MFRSLIAARTGWLRVALAGVVVGTAWVAPLSAHAVGRPAAPAYRTLPGEVLRPQPWLLPAAHYHLTGRFGDVSGLWQTVHTGLDFAAPVGTPIHAIAAGVVVSVGDDGAYGNKTVMRLPDGTVVWYCHQDTTRVHAGERIAAGQLIGTIGATGNTTGPHLHLEVHEHGRPVDPYAALVEHGQRP